MLVASSTLQRGNGNACFGTGQCFGRESERRLRAGPFLLSNGVALHGFGGIYMYM